MSNKLYAAYRSMRFFFAVVWRKEDGEAISIGEALYCSGVIYDLWMGRLE